MTKIVVVGDLPDSVRRLLAGAMTLNAMVKHHRFALAFGAEAEADLQAAARALPEYHRPVALRAAVLERVAFAHRTAGSVDAAADAFDEATRCWERAIDLLQKNPGAAADDATLLDEVARLRIRMLKCLILSDRPGARQRALADLRATPLGIDHHPRTLYNAACLCALLLPEHLADAWMMLGRALLASKTTALWHYALADEDLKPLPGVMAFVRNLRANRPAEPSEPDIVQLIMAARPDSGD